MFRLQKILPLNINTLDSRKGGAVPLNARIQRNKFYNNINNFNNIWDFRLFC